MENEEPGTEVAEAKQPLWKTALIGARERFISIAGRDQIVEWRRESMFALQALEKNEYLRKVADQNPASLRNAIINVAACGITLNPASQYAALVPRDGAVCLDIMYRGLIKIATDAGSIRWVQAELVYSTDKFRFRGKTEAPLHEADVFSKERGAVVGVYCVAKTVDGDILTETMTTDECLAIRDRSAYWAKKKAGPWKTDPGEMMKKTVIKRARKTWPETATQSQSERLHKAIELANEADGYEDDIDHTPAITPGSGAWEALEPDEKESAKDMAIQISKTIKADGPDKANDLIASWNLDADMHVAVWGLLDSKERSALKKADKAARAAA